MIPDVMEYRIHPYPFVCWYDPIFFAPNEHGIVPSFDVGVSGGRIGNANFAYFAPPAPIFPLGYVGSTPSDGVGKIFENPAIAQSAVYCNIGPWYHNPGGVDTYRILVFSEMPESVIEGDEFEFELKPKRMPQNDYTHCEKTGTASISHKGVSGPDVLFVQTDQVRFVTPGQLSETGKGKFYFKDPVTSSTGDSYNSLQAFYYTASPSEPDSSSKPIKVVKRDAYLDVSIDAHVLAGDPVVLQHRVKTQSGAGASFPEPTTIGASFSALSGASRAVVTEVNWQPLAEPSDHLPTSLEAGVSFVNDVVRFDADWQTGSRTAVVAVQSRSSPFVREVTKSFLLEACDDYILADIEFHEIGYPGIEDYECDLRVKLMNMHTGRIVVDEQGLPAPRMKKDLGGDPVRTEGRLSLREGIGTHRLVVVWYSQHAELVSQYYYAVFSHIEVYQGPGMPSVIFHYDVYEKK